MFFLTLSARRPSLYVVFRRQILTSKDGPRTERIKIFSTAVGSSYILNYPEIKYDQRCTMLYMQPLSYRREITDLLYVFKYIKGYYVITKVISNSSLRSGNAGRVLRMKIVRTESFKIRFFNRIVPMWNALPQQIRGADSIYYFKRKLVMHYDNLLTDFDTDNICTWSGTCRCHSCVCNRGVPR